MNGDKIVGNGAILARRVSHISRPATSIKKDRATYVIIFRSREHGASPGFNRFLVPPAALAVHLCIGQVYAFSTFNLPLTRLIGLTNSAPTDWNLKDIGWIFSIAIVFLGLASAVFGRWVERVGPRKSMFASALCFGGGFLVSAVGIQSASTVDPLPGRTAYWAAADSASPTSRRSQP